MLKNHATVTVTLLVPKPRELRYPIVEWWLTRLAFWLRRGRTRRALAELDDHLLRDIGRTPAEARQESAKLCWKT